MLLGDFVLSAARVWAHRQAAEEEAACFFSTLAEELRAIGGEGRVVAAARAASEDERRHARLCASIVEHLAPDLRPPGNRHPSHLPSIGPSTLTRADRTLYACVALSCVTETLSTALLMEMRPRIGDDLVRGAVSEILRDEVSHARIGWAHLAATARRSDVGWLAPHIPHMLCAALPDETSAPGNTHGGAGAPELGVLSREDVLRISQTVCEEVLRPGLARHGITVDRKHFDLALDRTASGSPGTRC